MRRVLVLAVVAVLLTVTIGATIFIVNNAPPKDKSPSNQPFYVGVTYCGNTTAEAKQLVDEVKNYTNLFILDSGPLQNDSAAINQIGNYAVDSGLNFIVYFGRDSAWLMKTWLDNYNGHWGNHFLGVYFGDEAGGKMLDNEMNFYDQNTQSAIMKYADGSISGYKIDANTSVAYEPDGTMIVTTLTNREQAPPLASNGTLIVTSPENSSAINPPSFDESYSFTTYYPNGTITATTYQDSGNPSVMVQDHSNVPYTYDELWNARPFKSYDETAQKFVKEINSQIHRAKTFSPQLKFDAFTSDYALYWYDYLSGYDVVLAQFGWNQSITQDIALARGAANLQGKDWGAMITWKYSEPPYLASGDEIYQQMIAAYENGAKYVAVFNYAQDMQGTNGTLQPEHFQALQRFWNQVAQDQTVKCVQTKAEVAFVLPRNYGAGLRNQQDIVWGLWQPTQQYQQVWPNLQNALAKYGQKLDIVYDDSAHPAAGKYSQIIYWNQTS